MPLRERISQIVYGLQCQLAPSGSPSDYYSQVERAVDQIMMGIEAYTNEQKLEAIVKGEAYDNGLYFLQRHKKED